MEFGSEKRNGHILEGRTLHFPRMSTEGAECLAAAFRSFGAKAKVSPPSDDETLKLVARFTTGEECLPQRVTMGNFLKIVLDENFIPAEHAFFMPTSSGPCRFGQYAPLFQKVLRDLGFNEAIVFAPTSSNGYEGISTRKRRFQIIAWRAVIASDAIRKLLLMFRPYERSSGDSDAIMDRHLIKLCSILSQPEMPLNSQMNALIGVFEEARDDFLRMPLAETPGSRPLIGVVGEIFLRFNEFSNQNILRKIEAAGGETWIAGVAEWIYYTNADQKRKLRDLNQSWSLSMIGAYIRGWWQHWEEKRILSPLDELFATRPESRVEELLSLSRPYLPADKALGEMTLNTGNAIAFYHAGCDGVVDISPFTCMNGIVTEAIYPNVSHDLNGFPVRIFYFDGVPFDLDRDLEIFMELVHAYRRKRFERFRSIPSGKTAAEARSVWSGC